MTAKLEFSHRRMVRRRDAKTQLAQPVLTDLVWRSYPEAFLSGCLSSGLETQQAASLRDGMDGWMVSAPPRRVQRKVRESGGLRPPLQSRTPLLLPSLCDTKARLKGRENHEQALVRSVG